MARESFRSLYGDLTKLKDNSLLKDPAGGAADDDELFQLLLAVSDWVDRYCNRHFYPRTETLVFDGRGTAQLLVPDLISVTSLDEDTNGDLTFNETWATSDYWLQPYNASPTQHWGNPYTAIKSRSAGNKSDGFTAGERNIQIAGRLGTRSPFARRAVTGSNRGTQESARHPGRSS